MVLVDTSVWIRFLAKRSSFALGLDRLLENEEVTGHELVYGELLMGDNGGRSALLTAYEQIEHTRPVSHLEAVAFVKSRKLKGRGIGWIDVNLLASAVIGQVRFWTADTRLAAIAKELGISFEEFERGELKA